MQTPNSHVVDKVTDVMAAGWLAAYLTDMLTHVPWVNLTAMLMFFWTVGRVAFWVGRKIYLWRKGKSFITISRDD